MNIKIIDLNIPMRDLNSVGDKINQAITDILKQADAEAKTEITVFKNNI